MQPQQRVSMILGQVTWAGDNSAPKTLKPTNNQTETPVLSIGPRIEEPTGKNVTVGYSDTKPCDAPILHVVTPVLDRSPF